MSEYRKAYYDHHKDSIQEKAIQFSIKPLGNLAESDAYTVWQGTLMARDAWGYKGPALSCDFDKATYLVGFPPTKQFHLGYLSVLGEAFAWAKLGGRVVISLGVTEALLKSQDQEAITLKTAACRQALSDYWESQNKPVISEDYDSDEFRKLELKVQGVLSVNKVNQVMGQPTGATLLNYIVASLMVTTFLLAYAIYPNTEQAIIPIGINELSYAELTKYVARNLGYAEPTFILRWMIKDLKNKDRMSSSQTDNAIFYKETSESVSNKIRKATTSLIQPSDKNHHIRPLMCNMLSLAAHLNNLEIIENAYNACIAGNQCKNCKGVILGEQPISN